jgi:hypothetical protein
LRRLLIILFQIQNDITDITIQKLLINLFQIAIINIRNERLWNASSRSSPGCPSARQRFARRCGYQ